MVWAASHIAVSSAEVSRGQRRFLALGTLLCACGRHTVSYWSTHGSDDSLAGYQATAATIEELTADCCDRQPSVVMVAA